MTTPIPEGWRGLYRDLRSPGGAEYFAVALRAQNSPFVRERLIDHAESALPREDLGLLSPVLDSVLDIENGIYGGAFQARYGQVALYLIQAGVPVSQAARDVLCHQRKRIAHGSSLAAELTVFEHWCCNAYYLCASDDRYEEKSTRLLAALNDLGVPLDNFHPDEGTPLLMAVRNHDWHLAGLLVGPYGADFDTERRVCGLATSPLRELREMVASWQSVPGNEPTRAKLNGALTVLATMNALLARRAAQQALKCPAAVEDLR
jgi:hypothetical protein